MLKTYFIKSYKAVFAISVSLLFQANLLALAKRSFGIQAYLPTVHLTSQTVQFGEKYSYKLDDSGHLVWLPGLKVSYDEPTLKSYFQAYTFRFMGAINKDCMNQLTVLFHLGPRWTIWQDEEAKWMMLVGAGPAFWMRESWEEFDFYRPSREMNQTTPFFPNYEHRWFPITGDFELAWKMSDNLKMTYTVVPVPPYIFHQTYGFQYTLAT